ncbi:MAG: potassium transporter Trk, partial [Oscillospiraceae bacterium]|nr:potassium transporter Trk [Oscillospiraceae bacterium]
MSTEKNRIQQSPARMISVSFLLVILCGTVLLTMPFSSKSGEFTNVLDALFTATSATCVTGLVVFDTFAKWSGIGQFIILILIQIGGLGLITMTTFFNVANGRKLGFRKMQLAQESVNSFGVDNIKQLTKFVVFISLLVEFIGAALLSTSFLPKYGVDGIWISIFLAVSAFCNAGFDILGRETPFISLCNYSEDLTVLFTIMALIIIGGLGFIVWSDLYNYHKTKKLMLHTKIVLIITGILLIVGTVLTFIFEYYNLETIGSMPLWQKIVNSLFHSVSLRTAGFNTIPLDSLTEVSKFLSVILMFIGAAPGSTGGGIKVTTIVVLIMTVVCTMRGRDDTIIMKRRVDKRVVYKALTIITIGFAIVIITTGAVLFAVDGAKETDALFEATS